MVSFPQSDVFVVGGGPVGLAVAIAARRKGFSVTLADAQRPPIDKACGEGVLPDGVAVAHALGLHLPSLASFNIRGIRFRGPGVVATADFPHGPGRGVRRTALHAALVVEAERCGVALCWGTSIGSLSAIPARWIVGADGMRSRVRTWAGLDRSRRDSRRFGFRHHFRCAPWSDYVDVYWGSGFQLYVTPVAPDEVGVALLTRDPKLRVADAIPQFPDLAAHLAGKAATSTERGGLTSSRQLHRVTRGNIALIGDASGSVDAISGEGLCLGFQQALALADAMEQANLRSYESAHRRLSIRPRFMADFMLMMERWPWIKKRGLPALASHPELFRSLLAMHVGAGGAAEFASTCVALGWHMLTI